MGKLEIGSVKWDPSDFRLPASDFRLPTSDFQTSYFFSE